ncbi:CatB-related O-acetyltransferase [Pelosinus sp. sgz500959]|uniref:CatB-related O-acetyltransferase n=1 Tax=Pelosinus sp. sgz500959 TaxID=3242472 RepID=UPI00366D9AEE
MFGVGTHFRNLLRTIRYAREGLKIKHVSYIDKGFQAEAPIEILYKVLIESHVFMGKYTYMVSGRIYQNTKIGRYCSVGTNVNIGLPEHPTNYLSTHPFQYSKDYINKETVIGNDVWLGNNACIKSGITVGTGAIVGAGSIVTKDVPPYAIVAGVPAKIIRYRFDEKTIQELLMSSWWDKDILELDGLSFDNIHECLKKLKTSRV